MSEWKKCKLSDVAEKFAMGPFGSNIKAENFVNSGVPVIRGTNMNYPKYVDGDFVFLTQEKADQLKSSNCYPGDLVFTHRGTLGQVGLIPEGKYDRYVISQSGMKVTVNQKLIDNNWLFYFFKSDIGQYELLQHESQVGVPSISNPLTSLKSVSLNLPPLPEQKAISGVLSSLDDKIDLLHRQNKTLEAMAEALFRQWFVEEAEDGWEEVPLYNCAQFINGSAFKDSDFDTKQGALPIVKIAEMKNGITQQTKFTSKSLDVKYYIQDQDVLFSWSGTPETSLGIFIWMGGRGVLNQHIFKVVPHDASEKYWIYYLLKYCMGEFVQFATHKQTIGLGHVTVADLKTVIVKKPDIFEIVERSNGLRNIFDKTVSNLDQIHTLEKLRDTLLPKLMSGEVKVIE